MWLENAYSHDHAQKLGFWGYLTPKIGSNINKTSKRHISGRSGSRGVLIMSVSSIVCEKSCGNKRCDEEKEEEDEELRHIFGRFCMTVKWP